MKIIWKAALQREREEERGEKARERGGERDKEGERIALLVTATPSCSLVSGCHRPAHLSHQLMLAGRCVSRKLDCQ